MPKFIKELAGYQNELSKTTTTEEEKIYKIIAFDPEEFDASTTSGPVNTPPYVRLVFFLLSKVTMFPQAWHLSRGPLRIATGEEERPPKAPDGYSWPTIECGRRCEDRVAGARVE